MNAEENQVHTFKLGEVLDISMVNSLYDGLKILLQEASSIIVDAEEVQRIDTSAMQLILCWYRDAQEKNITVTWKNVDGVFRNSSDLLGLSGELAL